MTHTTSGTIPDVMKTFGDKDVVLVQGPSYFGFPDVFEFGVFRKDGAAELVTIHGQDYVLLSQTPAVGESAAVELLHLRKPTGIQRLVAFRYKDGSYSTVTKNPFQ